MAPPSGSSFVLLASLARVLEFVGAGIVLLLLAAGWIVILAMVRRNGIESIVDEIGRSLVLVWADARRLWADLCAAVRKRVAAAKPLLDSFTQQIAQWTLSLKRPPTESAVASVAAASSDKSAEVKPGFADALLQATSSAIQSAPVVARYTTRPMQEFTFTVDTSNEPRAQSRTGRAAPTSKETAVQLHCADCDKRYRVKGNLGERQIPCPACGSALDVLDGELRTTVATISDAVPVISVVCKHCTAIIDAPTSAVGTAVSCPRCRAELMVNKARDSSHLHELPAPHASLAAG